MSEQRRDQKGRFAGGVGGLVGMTVTGAADNVARRNKKLAEKYSDHAHFSRYMMRDQAKNASTAMKIARANAGFAESSVLGSDPRQRHTHYLVQSRGWAGRAKEAGRGTQVFAREVKSYEQAALDAAKVARQARLLSVAPVALGAPIVGGALLAHHLKEKQGRPMNDDEIAKFLNGTGTKVKNALNSVHISSQQARTAGVMSQVGGGAGAVTGAVIGTGIGLATKHPAQGAGIGAGIGGALGGSGGSALGLYAGRAKKPVNRVAMPKKNEAQDTVQVNKPKKLGRQSDYELAKSLVELAKNMTEGDLQRDVAKSANQTGRDLMVGGGATATAAGASAGLHALNGLRTKKKAGAAVDELVHHAQSAIAPGKTIGERFTHGVKAFDAGKVASTAGEAAIGARAAMHTNLKVAGAGAALAGVGALLHAGTTPKPPRTALAKSFDESKHHRGHGGQFAAGGGALLSGGGAGYAGHRTVQHGRAAGELGEKGRFWREGAGEFGRDASVASKLARANVNFAQSASSAPDTADRAFHYMKQSRAWSLRAAKFGQNAQTEGKRAQGLLQEASSAKKVALGHGAAGVGLGLTAAGLGAVALHRPEVKKSFTHPSDETQHKLAQGGLAAATVADAAGAASAFRETKNAVKPALEGLSTGGKIKAVAGFAREKSAFPIVAGGIAATALAEHVMHNQQKQKQAALPKPPASPKPPTLPSSRPYTY